MATENAEASISARAIDSSEGINKSENAEAPPQTVDSRAHPVTAAETSKPPGGNDEMDGVAGLSVTHALEALLGGLEPVEETLTTADLPSKEPDTATLHTVQEYGMEVIPNNDGIQGDLNTRETAEVGNEVASAEEKASSTAISQVSDVEAAQLSNAPATHNEALKPVIPGLGLWNNGPETKTQLPQESTVQNAAVAEGDVEMADSKELPKETASISAFEAQRVAISKEDMPIAGTKESLAETNPEQMSKMQGAGVSADSKEPPIEQISESVSEAQKGAVISENDVKMANTNPTEIVSENIPVPENSEVPDEENGEGEHPEWEIDSSPIESSSDDSSSDDSSSDESEEGENSYKLLSPEEQARILMKGDGDSDDEGGKANASGGQLRTKNEVPDVVIPKPDVVITENMPITELGAVEQIVDHILLIKAKTSGEYKVLESGSVLCLADRTVIGVVAETIGRVQQPFYSVLFTNPAELKSAGLSNGVQIYYSEQHSTFVFTQALKAFKGSDASNLHDEEVGDEEMEFSDDEAEAEHKRRVKQKKIERRGGKAQQNGNRGGHSLQQKHNPYDASKGLSYDDNDDGLYTPLARPASYASTVGRSEAPQESSYTGNQNNNRDQGRDNFRGRGRGDRGKGDRGRGRGDRGRGRGGYQDRRSSGYSLPPQSQPSPSFQSSPSPTTFSQPTFQPQIFSPPIPNSSATVPTPNFYNTSPSTQQFSPNQPQIPAWPQFQPNYQQNPYQPQQNTQNSWPNVPPPGLPGGAFINPAFFNQNNQPNNVGPWNQQNQRGGRNNRGT